MVIRKEYISIKVQIGFDKDDRIAAFANKTRDGEYIIEVNMPSYFIIYSFCHSIVLQKIYPFISYDNNENKRGFYAELLTTIMLDILVYHEIGHIVNGHIDYIKDKENECGITNDLPYAFSYVEKYLSNNTIKNLELYGAQQSMALVVSAYTALYTLMEMGVRCENAEEYKSFEHLPKRIRLEKSLESIYYYINNIKSYRIGEKSI